MIEELGTVVSTFDSPSPSKVDFVVTKGIVHRGQFVELSVLDGKFIALVTNVLKTNKYFERADSVKEFESNGQALFEQFPVGEWEFLLAETKPLGVFTSTGSKRPSFPPSPGTKVFNASSDLLKKFFHFEENGLHLGELEYHPVSVKLNLNRLLKKHVAVLAMSGAGKSWAVGSLIEELLDRKKEQGRVAIVVLDPHGEYSSFAQPVKANSQYKDYSDKTKIVKGQNIKIAVPKLSASVIAGIIPGLSAQQKRDLDRVLNELRKEMKSGLGPFDWTEVLAAIKKDEKIKGNTRNALLSWIDELHSLNLFSKTDSPSIRELVKPATLTVIDLSDIIDMKRKQVIVSYFAKILFNERRDAAIPPTLLILEEAHQFIPQMDSREAAVSRGILRTIAREGRKFGISLCLISQRPVQLDTTTLSQCNTQIIMRITNPNDLKHISESAEAIDGRSLQIINSLQVGEALLIGEATGFPLFFRVRWRKSHPSKHEQTLEESAISFEEANDVREKETDAFL